MKYLKIKYKHWFLRSFGAGGTTKLDPNRLLKKLLGFFASNRVQIRVQIRRFL